MSLSNQYRSPPKKAVKESSQYSDLEEELKLLEDALSRKKCFRKRIENELLEKVKTVNDLKIKNYSLQEEVDDLWHKLKSIPSRLIWCLKRSANALDSSKVDWPANQNKAMETETVDFDMELDKCMLNGKQRKEDLLRDSETCDKFRKSLKDLFEKSLKEANQHQRNGNYAEALKVAHFCIGLAEFPKQQSRAWILAGRVFGKLNRHNDAIQCYNNVLQHYSVCKKRSLFPPCLCLC
ncbi:hypothetical protein M3Y97_01156500 [Aphelenchoides bicaudatus]|nr:hypothetical protein M3Y97_01156500 [Aphelenchoides bicaudatus]